MRIIQEDILAKALVSNELKISEPKEGKIFYPDKGEETRLISVKGVLSKKEVGKGRKILVVIRTDRNYPQALGLAKEKWEFPECRLGGVDHQIFAVLLDFEDNPIFRSKSVRVRLIRK